MKRGSARQVDLQRRQAPKEPTTRTPKSGPLCICHRIQEKGQRGVARVDGQIPRANPKALILSRG
ncbi:hypothetical protein M404DRAFT_742877 [Pisolithus tinctorius Marx 270]|uniref:Uncharacterized protein n=1 Tax=Pisolithus tinctorius Marx 270 TaxID=870435 RepID=A0A0C3IWB9_PISTI|nr:hypothetical protein M404DRAFT_742877 [Pisolithus tinctorius Marx 270]